MPSPFLTRTVRATTQRIGDAFDYCFPKAAFNRAVYRQAMGSFREGSGSRLRTTRGNYSAALMRGGNPMDQRTQQQEAVDALQLYKRNVIFQTLVDAEATNIIADGFTLKATTVDGSGKPYKAFNDEVESAWYDWFERADYTGFCTASELQQLWWKHHRFEGDGLIVLVDQTSQTGNPSRLQYITRNRISTPRGARLDDGSSLDTTSIYDGIEVDGAMRPTGFWVRTDDGRSAATWTRVDANSAIYICNRKHAEEVRGTSVASSIFEELDKMRAFSGAVTTAGIAAAMIALTIQVADPAKAASAFANPASLTQQDSAGVTRRALYLEEGMLKYIGSPGEIAQVNPQQPMSNATDWDRTQFKKICLAFDMPLELGGRDLSQVNFSGGRIGLLQYYRTCQHRQEVFMRKVLDRIFQWWISREVKRGTFENKPPAKFFAHTFTPRGWDFNDPQAEAVADMLEIAGGFGSVEMACAKRGRDVSDILEAAKRYRSAAATAGIPIVVPTQTRDETIKTTMIDASGNPVASEQSGAADGAQLSAVQSVIDGLTDKTLSVAAATSLLGLAGIGPDDVTKIIAGATSAGVVSSKTLAFKRDVVLGQMAVPQARDVGYNITDQSDLYQSSGLKLEPNYKPPFAAVVAPPGQLTSGSVVTDPTGDIVGGDVENALPAEENGRNGDPDGGNKPFTPGKAKDEPADRGGEDPSTSPGQDSKDGNDDGNDSSTDEK